MDEKRLNLVKAYQLYQKISAYPELAAEIRRTFMEVLEERGILSLDALEREAGHRLAEDEGVAGSGDATAADAAPGAAADATDATDAALDASLLQTYRDALIDLYFASHVERGGEYINLVRKRDRARNLVRILGTGDASPADVATALKEFCAIPKGDIFISEDEAEGIRVELIGHFISSQLPFIGVAKKHLTLRDVDSILNRTLWNKRRFGKLGGKAAGMILAHLILLPTLSRHDPELEEHLRIPETWYLNSGLFTTFLEQNGLYFTRTFKYKERLEIESEFSSVKAQFQQARFSGEVLGMFRGLLEQIGEHPIIIRSSSHLEDSFGLAFSGKYESIFLANQGTLEQRLAAFIGGVKRVLASMYKTDPILYRKAHGLLDYNEQMAMIVQKVVGRRFGDYFLPLASGVLFSYNSYRWTPRIESDKGLARIVFGLGTRAVDRVGSDYPRMVPLSHPQLRPEVSAEQIAKYSQKMVDVINLAENRFETVDFQTLCERIRHPDLFYAVSLIRDGEIVPPLFKNMDFHQERPCLTFEKLIRQSGFLPAVRKALSRLEEAYGRPVDVEFAWDQDRLYLLQCRTLSTRKGLEGVSIPDDIPDGSVLFRAHSGLSDAVVQDIEYVIYVDPRAYKDIGSFERKVSVSGVIGALNHALFDKRFALLGPGRWGSNDINLGVKVSYGDINNAALLAEIAFTEDGMTPEVSYGTHFFQDLVEADIAMVPLYPDDPSDVFDERFLLGAENRLEVLAPEYGSFREVVRVVHVPAERSGKLLQVVLDGREQRGLGFYEEPRR